MNISLSINEMLSEPSLYDTNNVKNALKENFYDLKATHIALNNKSYIFNAMTLGDFGINDVGEFIGFSSSSTDLFYNLLGKY